MFVLIVLGPASFLQLFKSHFKLAIGILKIRLCLVSLLLKEREFALPQSSISLIGSLDFVEFSLLLLSLQA